jgi:hypothetical protein
MSALWALEYFKLEILFAFERIKQGDTIRSCMLEAINIFRRSLME